MLAVLAMSAAFAAEPETVISANPLGVAGFTLHNIAADRQGNIFTSEVNTGQRIQKFRRLDLQNQ